MTDISQFRLLLRIDSAVRAVCPIDGVAIIDRTAHTVRIDHAADATPAQRAAAHAALLAFDWRDRRPRSLEAIIADLDNWLGPGVNIPRLTQLVELLVARAAQNSPTLLQEHGIPIPGDEPDV